MSTGVYRTRAFAGDRADWPRFPLAIPMPDAPMLESVTRKSLIEAARLLGLAKSIGERELNRMMAALPSALEDLIDEIAAENALLPTTAKSYLAGEVRLLNTLQHLVIPEILARLN